MMAAAVVLLVLFVLCERRMAAQDKPQLLNYNLITNRNFLLGAGVTTIFASGIPGFFMVISIMLQVGFGFSPIDFRPDQHAVFGGRAAGVADRRPLRLALPADPRRHCGGPAGDRHPVAAFHHRRAGRHDRPLDLPAAAAGCRPRSRARLLGPVPDGARRHPAARRRRRFGRVCRPSSRSAARSAWPWWGRSSLPAWATSERCSSPVRRPCTRRLPARPRPRPGTRSSASRW